MGAPRKIIEAPNGVKYDPNPHPFDFVERDCPQPDEENWEHQEHWDKLTFSDKIAWMAAASDFLYVAHEEKALLHSKVL